MISLGQEGGARERAARARVCEGELHSRSMHGPVLLWVMSTVFQVFHCANYDDRFVLNGFDDSRFGVLFFSLSIFILKTP